MKPPSQTDFRRGLPAVGSLLSEPEIAALVHQRGQRIVVSAIRKIINRARASAEEASDWVAEVISPDSRATDTVDKLAQYAEVGTPEYWLIDSGAGTVIVYVLGEGEAAYTLSANYSAGGTIRSTVLEGFEVAVNDLLGSV